MKNLNKFFRGEAMASSASFWLRLWWKYVLIVKVKF